MIVEFSYPAGLELFRGQRAVVLTPLKQTEYDQAPEMVLWQLTAASGWGINSAFTCIRKDTIAHS